VDLGRFFSFLILYTVGRTPWTGDQPVGKAATYAQDNTNTDSTHTNIHALSEIRTHDPSVQAGEDGLCLRPRGHWDRRNLTNRLYNYTMPNLHKYILNSRALFSFLCFSLSFIICFFVRSAFIISYFFSASLLVFSLASLFSSFLLYFHFSLHLCHSSVYRIHLFLISFFIYSFFFLYLSSS
jgi:hypothetical protein